MDIFNFEKGDWFKERHRLKPIIDKYALKFNSIRLYENINKACSNEWAFLFLSGNSFFFIQPKSNKGITYLSIPFAFGMENNVIAKYQPSIEKLSTLIDAQYLEFETPRKAWNKVAPKFGWEDCGINDNFTIWRHFLGKSNE